jgi:hypothetical protein
LNAPARAAPFLHSAPFGLDDDFVNEVYRRVYAMTDNRHRAEQGAFYRKWLRRQQKSAAAMRGPGQTLHGGTVPFGGGTTTASISGVVAATRSRC